jgi:DNA repair protein RadC
VLYLNGRNVLIAKEKINVGDDRSTIIDSKAIVRRALEKKASGIILVHNHPSGNALPSVADIGQTQTLKRALGTCDISLMDHVVIGGDGYYSFADEELVNDGRRKP